MAQKRGFALLRLDLINAPDYRDNNHDDDDDQSHSVKSSARRSETPQLSARDNFTPRDNYLSPRRPEDLYENYLSPRQPNPPSTNLPELDDEEEELIDALLKMDSHQWVPPPPSIIDFNETVNKVTDDPGDTTGDEDIDSKIEEVKKKSIVEKPKEPFLVAYQCSCCQKYYSDVVTDNPWYHMVRHECPHCHREQYPFLDIHVAVNGRELDPNTTSYYEELHDEEFLDLAAVNDSDDFSMTLTQPLLELLFSGDHLTLAGAEGIGSEAEGKTLTELIDLRLLALVTHAVRCKNVQHSALKQTNLCRNTKVLLLHMTSCKKEDCSFPCCKLARPVLCYLSCFPSEETNLTLKDDLKPIQPEQKLCWNKKSDVN